VSSLKAGACQPVYIWVWKSSHELSQRGMKLSQSPDSQMASSAAIPRAGWWAGNSGNQRMSTDTDSRLRSPDRVLGWGHNLGSDSDLLCGLSSRRPNHGYLVIINFDKSHLGTGSAGVGAGGGVAECHH
jgi:hypothetical protein